MIAGVMAVGLATLFLFQQGRQARLSPERLQHLTDDLLPNVYRAIEYRGEEVIYYDIARTTAGELLSDVYLETRRRLEKANHGGSRVKVKDFDVLEVSLTVSDGDSMTVESRWRVSGSVGHWGHIHQRQNGYHDNLQISEIDGSWKLTGLDILQEERL